MRLKGLMMIGVLFFALSSCQDDEDERLRPKEYTYDFDSGMEEWIADFADYPEGEGESYDLEAEFSTLPSPLDNSEGAIKVSGTNMSDDLFMFIKKKITGLEPRTAYSVSFTVSFASDVADGMVGVGGSPGESVYIKAGATNFEPVPQVDNMGYYRMNIDKGNQSQGGNDAVVLGDFSNDTDEEIYTIKTVYNVEEVSVTADENGEAWVIVGTDSGFESTTTIYYDNIDVFFELYDSNIY